MNYFSELDEINSRLNHWDESLKLDRTIEKSDNLIQAHTFISKYPQKIKQSFYFYLRRFYSGILPIKFAFFDENIMKQCLKDSLNEK